MEQQLEELSKTALNHPVTEDDFARVIGLHTYSQSPRRDYDITLTGEWVERGGFRFEEFVLTPRREDGNDGRTE